MEMLLKVAFVKEEENKKSIQFLDQDIENDEKFQKSFNNVVTLIDGYDIAKCTANEEKDIFYLYSFHTKYDDLDWTVNRAVYGNNIDIQNLDESKLIDSIKGNNPTSIFWDVISDSIIVIGLDNLKTLLLHLEKKRWECIKIQNEEFMQEYMDLCASNVYKKVMKPA